MACLTPIPEPLISKELFEKARAQIQSEQDFRYEVKEFAFTKLLRCGKCSSGVSAQEKYKKLKDGGLAKYVYYGCTRSKDLHCGGGYLREEELIRQLTGLIEKLTIDELGLRKSLKEEIERHERFRTMLGVQNVKIRLHDVDLKTYAKHTLESGTLEEKRGVLAHLKDRLVLTEKTVKIE